MADKSAASTLALKIETTSGTYDAPSSSDALVVADLRLSIAGLTAQIDEYTGSIHKPGPIVNGKTFEVSGRVLLRGPGGTSTPVADSWLPGRLLRAAGFTEQITASPVPATAEAVTTGTTTGATLGAGAAATADTYNGMLVDLSSQGSVPASLSMVRDYTAAKVMTLAETFGSALTGDYQFPAQLSYIMALADPPTLSASVWLGSRRYNGKGLALSSFRLNFPTSSRDAADAVPSIEFTLTGDFVSDADEAAVVPAATLAVPPFRDGKLWVANMQLGGSSLTIDFGAQVAYPPNPNETSGNEAAQLVETTRTASLTLNQVAKSTIDLIGLADAQAYHAIEAMYGLGSGNFFGVIVTDARFNYQSPDPSGALVTTSGDMFIDGADKTIAISIPFYGA